MNDFVYKGEKAKEISFPLGGIGTGSVGVAGNGRFIDWEIFGRPNKGSVNGFTHLAVKAERNGNLVDARVLNGDLQPPYSGDYKLGNTRKKDVFGFGPNRGTLAGAPHFKDTEFKGQFPFAELRFREDKFPGNVIMTAFNPFIPLNDADSSLPAAFFDVEFENTQGHSLDYTLSFSVLNPLGKATVNEYKEDSDIKMIKMDSAAYASSEPEYGDLTVATDADDVSFQQYWYRGAWFDNLGIYWRNFTEQERFIDREFEDPGENDHCTLAARVQVDAGEKKRVRFVLSWNFPNMYNYWNPECCEEDGARDTETARSWKHYYATLFSDSTKSATYSLEHWDRLLSETARFKDALYSSSLPAPALEAVAANISILKTPTCLRLQDGSFYGFEGCCVGSGCCEGSCTHVWNYAYALPFLFPKLERSMRELDFAYNQREDGKMNFRLQLPLDRKDLSDFRACADGQFGGVIKTYREWKISGNTDWLKLQWAGIKKSLSFAWAESNEERWDLDRDGVLEGRQHHTLDMELFGPNSWLTGFYLAALKAGAEMADALGESETSTEYRGLFEKGKTWVDENLFNGRYYHQLIDLKDKTLLEKYDKAEKYWNAESEELKYQIAEGCGIDQVIAQWHANNCGLGEIFDPKQTKKALESIYEYNFKKQMRDFFNPCRLYCLNDEAGLVICEWPEDKYKPMAPLTYSEETMNGFEYQAAVHMIQSGLVDEGMNVVEAIRSRYDGYKRNPWNEFECGSNYARSMASYTLLTTFSGFEFDMTRGMIGFDPIDENTETFRCFWSLDSGWGTFVMKDDKVFLEVLYGELELNTLRLPFLGKGEVGDVRFAGEKPDFKFEEGDINFMEPVTIREGCILSVDRQSQAN